MGATKISTALIALVATAMAAPSGRLQPRQETYFLCGAQQISLTDVEAATNRACALYRLGGLSQRDYPSVVEGTGYSEFPVIPGALYSVGVSPGPYRVYLATTVDSCTRERVVELTASVTGTESQTCRQVSPSLLDTLWPF